MQKRRLPRIYTILAVLFSAYLFLSNSFSPPNNVSGAPGHGTCANCHSGANFGSNISISGLPANIMPNTTYNLTVTVSHTTGNPSRAGFQMVAFNSSNMSVGSFSNAGPNSAIVPFGATTFFEHQNAPFFGAGMSLTFTVDWTAPASPAGATITMYAAGNVVNGTGGTGGDDPTGGTSISGTLQAGAMPVTVAITNQTNVTCFGGNDGSATAQASGGIGAPYTYNWSNGQVGATAVNLMAGTYTVTATDGMGESATTSVTITQPSSQVSVIITNQTNIDCINPIGTATAQAAGGSPGYTYMWSTGASGPTATLPAGTHMVTSADINGCTATTSVTITQNATPPIAVIAPPAAINCNNSQVTLDGLGSSQGANFIYQWTTTNGNIVAGATTLTPIVNQGGSYTLTVTNNQNGCTSTANTMVLEDTNPPIAEAGPDMELTCDNASVQLDGTNSSQGGNFSYFWAGVASGETTLTPTVTAPGLYSIVVTDNINGCTSEDFVNVTNNTILPIADAGPDMQLTCTTSMVTLDGTSSSQGGDVSYEWTTSDGNIVSGENTLTPIVNAAGNYTLIVTNTANGCTSTDEAIVTEDSNMPTADAGAGMELTCLQNSVTLDGSGSSQGGNFAYLWTGPSILSGENTLTPTVNVAGTYCIEVTDLNNGCLGMDCVIVSDNTNAPTADAGTNQVLTCTQASITLDGSGSSQGANITYLWTTIGGNIVSGELTLTPIIDASGTYCIEVTDLVNGCNEIDCTIIEEDIEIPIADAGPSMVLNCNNTVVTLDGSASTQGATISYSWTGPSIVSGTHTLTPTVDAPGTYELFVANENNGCASVASVLVTENIPPSAVISMQTNVDCNGNENGSATVEVSNGNGTITYSWSSGGTEATENGLSGGTFIVTVTDADNCTATAEVTIEEPAALAANASSTNETSAGANDGTATATPSGGTLDYSYEWSTSETTQSIMDLMPDTYTVTVTDANNCSVVETVTVGSFDCGTVSVTITSVDVSCNGEMDGTATATMNGGAEPITYNWSNGSTEATANNLVADTYTVTVIDANNCEVIENVTITEPPVLNAGISNVINVDCFGNATGEATAVPSGGAGAYTFEWDDPLMQMTATATNLTAGTYTVTVLDVNSCSTTAEVTITEPSQLLPNTTSTNETALGAADGTAMANPTGGTPGYIYLWNTFETTPMIANLAPGEYCVTITDNNSCSTESCVTVDPFICTNLTTTVDVINVSCNGGSDGAITVSTTGGEAPYTYSWSTGATGETVTELPAGTYSVTCVDSEGCSGIIDVTIQEPDVIVLSLSSTDESISGANDGSASVLPTGGVGGYTFLWNIGATTATIENLSAGEYCVTVTDQNACTNSGCVTVGVSNCAASLTATPTPVSCNGDMDGSATAEIQGSSETFTFEWSNGSSMATINGLAPGIYTVTATDGMSCTLESSVEVVEPAIFITSLMSQTDIECEGEETGAATVMVEGGTPVYTFEWSTGAMTPTVTDLAPGIYTVTATDAKDCKSSLLIEILLIPDNTPPIVITQNINLELNADGMAFLTPDMVDGGSFDNCGVDSLYLDIQTFTCDDIGVNPVTLMVFDINGNCAFDTAYVEVIDVTAPEITCPSDIISTDCNNIINYDLPIGIDECGNVTLELLAGLESGSTFPEGVTAVSWAAIDGSNNQSVCFFQVTIDTNFDAEVDSINPSCFGANDGIASVMANGGTPPFSYQWDDPQMQTSETAIGLPAGTYTVIITDSGNCQAMASVTLEQPDQIIITVDNVTDETNNDMNGAISITPSGGTGEPFNFDWFLNGVLISNEEDLTGLAAGTYIVSTTDNSNCTVSDTIVVDMILDTNTPLSENYFSIQPNPSSGKFFLNLELATRNQVQIDVFDLTGKPILPSSQTILQKEQVTLDLTNVAEGVYLVRIIVDDVVMTRRVVVSD